MTRPKKAVVDYFPHYCNHGKTMFTIEQKYGNDGYAFWFKLLEILGKNENHFYDCNQPAEWEYLIATVRLNEDIVLDMLSTLAKLNAIDAELWNNKIIWSENFINNLKDLYSRRGAEPYNKPAILDYCMNLYPVSGISDCKNPQSIVKDIIVDDTKGDKSNKSIPKKSSSVAIEITNSFSLSDVDYRNCRLWFEYLYIGWVKKSNKIAAWLVFGNIYKNTTIEKREYVCALIGWTNYHYREMYKNMTTEGYKRPNFDKYLKEAKYLDNEDTFTEDNKNRVIRDFKEFVKNNGSKYV